MADTWLRVLSLIFLLLGVHYYSSFYANVFINKLAPKTSSVNLIWPQNETAMDNRSELRYARYRVKAYGRRIPYYSNAVATTQVLFLQLSGDVEANPGPAMKSTKPQCCSCSMTLKKNQNGVRCLGCSSTFHIKCSAMSRKELINYRRHGSPWYCFSCCMPQFTDSFFENSSGCLDLSAGDCLDMKDSIEWYSENINSYYKSNVKFGHLNINSVQNKMGEVRDMLIRNMFDILFIAETKIDSTYSDDLFRQSGYRIIRQDRKKGGGGLMAFVREDLKAYRRRKLEPDQVESICLDVIDSRKSRFIICACYRSEKMCKPADFLLSLTSAIELMYRCRQEVVLIGDFNLDMYINQDEGRIGNAALQEFCDRFCLQNQIYEPTRITDKTKTLIDVVLASHPERFATCGNLHLGVSDHDLVFAVRKNKLAKPKAREIEYRSMRQFNNDAFLQDLRNVPWDTAYIYDNVDDLWDHWATLFKEILDIHAPIKKKRIRGDQLPWITPEIQREISRRNRLFKLHARNPTEASWHDYRKQRNRVTSLKRRGMKIFCMDASINSKHQGEFWSKMKPLLPSKGKKQSKIILLEDGSLMTDTLTVANTFNNYFSEVAVTEGMDKITDDFANHPSVKLITEKCNNKLCFSFNSVSESYINGILVKLNPRKAVGCDFISQRLLRSSAPVLTQPLTKLINYFITNRLWPTIWKSSNITPVFKKTDETNKTCYRPVSVLPALSKIYGIYSDWKPTKVGVPQGSLLGPLLFNIYINDLNLQVTNSSLRLYADDTTEYASDASPPVLEYIINSDLHILSTWLRQNYLQINASKTQAMAIGPASYRYNFSVDNNEVDANDTLKILGVTLDRRLNFVAHVSEQVKKACAKASALRRIRRFLPLDVMCRLYKAYILPHLEYCCPLLLGVGRSQVKKLEDTNNYILRTILGYGKHTSYNHLLNIAGIRTLEERRKFQALVLVYKCFHNEAPRYIEDFFKIKICNYNLRGSGTLLTLPSFNLEWRHKSFSFLAAKLWNSLPTCVRNAKDISTFKRLLKKQVFR